MKARVCALLGLPVSWSASTAFGSGHPKPLTGCLSPVQLALSVQLPAQRGRGVPGRSVFRLTRPQLKLNGLVAHGHS